MIQSRTLLITLLITFNLLPCLTTARLQDIHAPSRTLLQSTNTSVVLRTSYGNIYIRLMPDIAPTTAEIILRLARGSQCKEGGCKFYRNEARPDADNPQGPPYALLQGAMAIDEIPPSDEGHVMVKEGHVAFIPGTKDWFIALGDHTEWGTSHTVFGVVDRFTVPDLITIQDYTEVTHEQYGTVMRMLKKEVPFIIDTDIFKLDPYYEHLVTGA